jgi:CubicO group peptidase (beta-lactamase class C family)
MANGFSKDRLARLHHALAAHVAAGDMPGVVALVSRRGEVHVEAIGTQSFGGMPMRRDTIFRIASMTKPVIAAATLLLIEEGKLRLDDPVDGLLPELANRKVLKALDGPVEDTVPARRAITTRDLLTFTFGAGAIMVWPAKHPIQHAAAAAGLAPGPFPLDVSADEFMKRLGALPLIYQPGERWLYHTGSDVLGVLIARAVGQPLETVLQERLFAPLGMRDTGFQVPAAKLDRFASAYMMDQKTKTLGFFDDAAQSRWSKAPPFASGGGGLVSTVDDYHAFYRMLLNGGVHGSERILARPTVALMMSDQLTAEQKQGAELFFGHGASWGMGGAVVTRRTDIFATPGRFGWDGGYGTSAHLDPAEDMIGILMTQRAMESPMPPKVFRDFWTGAYQVFAD